MRMRSNGFKDFTPYGVDWKNYAWMETNVPMGGHPGRYFTSAMGFGSFRDGYGLGGPWLSAYFAGDALNLDLQRSEQKK